MTKQARFNEWAGPPGGGVPRKLRKAQNLCKLTVKALQTQARDTGSGRLRGLSGDKAGEARRLMHVAKKCAAVLGKRHA
ncbi:MULTISPECIES: hypothetical protein [unclassified Mesorhizobium]|uniref:hypothetical protein n=1 Tax=unclassified Mesorhizobium TaxID=325217 RepID=UPI001672A985|nr:MULTISPECIES: hypothetical protein [unclassified Mesorhizobium]